jgi:hypothetical protein
MALHLSGTGATRRACVNSYAPSWIMQTLNQHVIAAPSASSSPAVVETNRLAVAGHDVVGVDTGWGVGGRVLRRQDEKSPNPSSTQPKEPVRDPR